MSRFESARTLLPRLLVIAVAALAGCRSAPADPDAGAAPVRPNIVVVLADDMGWGDPTCFNPDSKVRTPHLDRLAREGMRFTDAHAPGSVCVPTRYGLMTGRYPFRWRGRGIREGRPTLPSVLRRSGYRTGMVGKWHLGFPGWSRGDWASPMTGGPVDRGFDSWFGIPASLDIPPYYYIRGRTPVAPPTGRIAASGSPGWTDIQGAFWREGGVAPGFRHEDVLPRFEAEAVRWIGDAAGAADGRPFFLYLALPAPHTPWLPAARYRGRSGAGMYGDFVLQVDALVGRVLDALEESGAGDDTLLVFTSDNGPVWYEADEKRFAHRSTGPFRGMKGDAWEGGHRVPFLARWPGRVPAGTTTPDTICLTDLMATCAALAGTPLDDGEREDGVDLSPALLGRPRTAPLRATTILKRNASVVRSGRWKLISHLGSGGFSRPRRVRPEAGGPRGQLYDLAADPGETRNLWLERPDVGERMRALVAAERAR